LTYESTNT